MIEFEGASARHILKRFAESTGADYQEGLGEAWLELNNEVGQGTFHAYEHSPGITAFVYDLIFFEEISYKISKETLNPLVFSFCLEGFVTHKFSGDDEIFKLDTFQNVILSGANQKSGYLVFPVNTPIKMTVIFVYRDHFTEHPYSNSYHLPQALKDLIESFAFGDAFHYMGDIRPKTAEFAKIVLDKPRNGVVGRLLIEAAILNILASQLSFAREKKSTPEEEPPLKLEERQRILSLTEHISKNLESPWNIENLTDYCGLNAKKLQSGFQYLFGSSVASYIKNLRLEKARELLETKDWSVSQVVYSVGLNSRSSFSSSFKSRYGYLPSEYPNDA